jgi:hypothetical protein
MFLTGIISFTFFDIMGYSGLIALTLTVTILSLLILPFFQKLPQVKNVNKSIKIIIQQVVATLQKSPILLPIIIILGVGNAIVWQGGNILSIALLDSGINPKFVALIRSYEIVFMAIGYVLSYFFQKSLNVKMAMLIFTAAIVAMFISSFAYNIVTFICFSIFVLAFPMVHANIENQLEYFSSKELRSTITSFGTFIASMLNIVCTIGFGFMANKYSCKYGFLLIMSMLLFLSMIAIYVFRRLHKNIACK